MGWRTVIQKRQKRGTEIVGARLVFDNGEPDSITTVLGQDGEGNDIVEIGPNPAYESEERIWSRDPGQSVAAFRRMLMIERDAWIEHFNASAQNGVVESDL